MSRPKLLRLPTADDPAIRAVAALEKLRWWLSDPVEEWDYARMPVADTVQSPPPTFEAMWAVVQRRKP